ncbi:hypothetical protein EWS82_11340 [Staphylococcus xylosus]|nr:hypothetical protein [Staphylococcus xylosus]
MKRESSSEISKSEISVKQGSTLGALLLAGGYKWNTSFEGSAVSHDNIEKLKLMIYRLIFFHPILKS